MLIDKADEGGDKVADIATSIIKGSVNTDGIDEVECGPKYLHVGRHHQVQALQDVV